MNRGQLHADLYAEYLAEVEAAAKDRAKREQEEREDHWDDMEGGWESCYDLADDHEREFDDRDERDELEVANYYPLDWDWYDDAFEPYQPPESDAERYERLWREAGY
jgi:hypothetical protein